MKNTVEKLESQMSVEQAVFASNDNPRLRGYQIVAKSEGIDDQIAHQLVQWSPSHGGLLSHAIKATGLFFFQMLDDRLAFGRSVYGTPEYSGRGGLQTVTNYLVTHRQHLQGYCNDPWAFCLLARSEGWLRYNPPVPNSLPRLAMNESWDFGRVQSEEEQQLANFKLAEKAIAVLSEGRRVALLGIENPIPTLRWIIARMPVATRCELSFSIGIQPSVQRPFQLQFLHQTDVQLRSDLSADQVVLLRAN